MTEWNHWNVSLGVNNPPADVIIKAYASHDAHGIEYVGTANEILLRLKVHGLLNNSFIIMWKLTGIGQEQLSPSIPEVVPETKISEKAEKLLLKIRNILLYLDVSKNIHELDGTNLIANRQAYDIVSETRNVINSTIRLHQIAGKEF